MGVFGTWCFRVAKTRGLIHGVSLEGGATRRGLLEVRVVVDPPPQALSGSFGFDSGILFRYPAHSEISYKVTMFIRCSIVYRDNLIR